MNFYMIENGFHQQFIDWTNLYLNSIYKISAGTNESHQALSVGHLFGVFFLYMFGMSGGFVAFIAEMWYSRR